MKQKCKQWSLVIGRFQCIPPHAGHLGVIKTLLKEGKNVCIALREADFTEKNPYSSIDRRITFEKIFKQEIRKGTIKIIDIPDITEVCFGRTPGWNIREVKLNKNIEKISATKIRKNKK